MAKVALVSGSNKGIGFACVRALCKQLRPDDAVYLTARNPELGKKAVADLEEEGLTPCFHQLDISSQDSVEALRDHLREEHGGLDILINNAGMAYKFADKTPEAEQARVTCQVNYFGTARMFDLLSPILRSHARVVNVSSMTAKGALKRVSEEVRMEFKNAATREDTNRLVKRFIELVAAGEAERCGFTPGSNYGLSKLGLCTLSRIQSREIRKDISRPGINVYSVCPGYVATDMTSYNGTKTIDEGADTPVWLALQPLGSSEGVGEFFAERKVVPLL